MNRPESFGDDPALDDAARELLAIDAALEKTPRSANETPAAGGDSTGAALVSGNNAGDQLVAEQCLGWIEAIRMTAPDMLDDAFQSRVADDDPTLVGLPGGEADSPYSSDAAIGRFQVIRKIGQGGYGVVFLAHDPTLQRKVALKVPRPEILVTGDLKKRFLREAEAAASLDHPHIVAVYEAGSAGPVSYIASAYCPGGSLSQWLQNRGQVVSPRLAAELTKTLAGAVQHAHERGVLHRDIKPGNVLVEHEGDQRADSLVRSVRLCDFGLARVMETSPDESVSRDIVGTPAYMAPEQASNDRAKIGVATDVYGLGATLYQLLTGRPPIVGSSQLETLSAILTVDPIEPHQLRSDVPRDLSAICMKALEKEPAARYPSAAELEADLARFLGGQQVVARPLSSWQRAAKWCRRNPWVATWVAVSAAAMLGALIVALVGWSSTSRALKREQAALVEADRAYVETKDAIEEYYMTVSENQLLNAPGLTPLRKELLSNALDYYQRFVGKHENDPEALDELERAYVKMADVQEKLGDFDAALDAYHKALALHERQVVDEPSRREAAFGRGTILRKLAYLSLRVGNHEQALAQIEESLAIHRGLIDKKYRVADNRHQVAQLLIKKANIFQGQGKLAEAIQLYEEGEQIVVDLLRDAPADRQLRLRLAQLQGNRGVAYRLLGQMGKAQPLLESATAVYQSLVDDHPQVASYQENLGKALANLSVQASITGEQDQAMRLLKQATEVFDGLARAHPQVAMYDVLRATTRNEAGMLLLGVGRFSEAEKLLGETVRIYERVGNRSPKPIEIDLASAHLNLGLALLGLNDQQRARTLIDETCVMLEQLNQQSPNNFYLVSALSQAYEAEASMALKDQQPDEALVWLDKVRDQLQSIQKIMPNNKGILRGQSFNCARRADVYDFLKEHAQAVALRREALEIHAESRRALLQMELATSLLRSGELNEAVDLITESESIIGDTNKERQMLARSHAMLATAMKQHAEGDPSQIPTHRARAIELLEQLAAEDALDGFTVETIEHEDWASLHDSAEFQRIVERLSPSDYSDSL